jgi:hypothetical protein
MSEDENESMPPRPTVAGLPKYHTSREVPQTIHEGVREDCPRCSPPGAVELSAVGDADRMARLLDEVAKRIDMIDRIAGKGAEGLENLSVIISQRIHFVGLLERAAAMIDPDRPEGTASYEARLDWLAKWREVVGR